MKIILPTWITLMGRPVSNANCSLRSLVGFGVCSNAVFSLSNCLDLIVVRGPLPRLPFKDCSSGNILSSCWTFVNPYWSPCMMVSVVVIVDVCDTVDAADVFFSSFSIRKKLDLQFLPLKMIENSNHVYNFK